jgi:uncharacterized protein involved in type VI secretion and phage assembly
MSFVDPKGPYPSVPRHRLHGVYPALVEKVTDPDEQGRVLVKLPWIAEDDMSGAMAWARLATLMAGGGRGSWFIPEKGDEVLVAFIAGDPRWPVVVGALWNGVDAPPETMDGAGENNLRSITSRSGHKLTFDDTSGAEKVEIVTKGQHQLTLDDQSREIVLRHSGGAEIKIDQSGTVSIRALNRVEVDAPAGMTVTAAQLSVDAPISKFSGVVKAETVITNAVVSSSYTPGAGNVW